MPHKVHLYMKTYTNIYTWQFMLTMCFDECLLLFIWSSRPSCISLTSGGSGDWVSEACCIGTSFQCSPVKILETKVQESFSGWQHLYNLSQIVLGRITHCPCDSLKMTAGIFLFVCFSWTSSCPFIFCWFQYVSFCGNKS